MQFLIPLLLGWLVVWGASWFLPSRYRSSTLILVEQPTMPKDYVTPNVNDDLQDRLRSITQQILSRTRLLHIIDQLNLYADSNGHLTPDDKVESMRKTSRSNWCATAKAGSALSTFPTRRAIRTWPSR
jgi:succinoglycan biosynthesis transport protein ExoP